MASQNKEAPPAWAGFLNSGEPVTEEDIWNAKIACRTLDPMPNVHNNQCNRMQARGVNLKSTGWLGNVPTTCGPVKVSGSENVNFGVAVATEGPCSDLVTLDSTLSGRVSGAAAQCSLALTPQPKQVQMTAQEWEDSASVVSNGLMSSDNSPALITKEGNYLPDVNAFGYDYTTSTVNLPTPSGFPDAPYSQGVGMNSSSACSNVLSDINVGACEETLGRGKCNFMGNKY